jgi:starvation-inducible DNA-binding protein
MEKLIAQMKVVQASVFALYLKAHNFHWNVEGPNFSQYHSFLDGLYNEWWTSVDAIAEEIRSTRSYAPGSFSRFKELSVVEDEVNIPTAMSMLAKLRDDNAKVIEELVKARQYAEDAKAFGLVNFFEDRIDKHYKNDWMLRAITRS